MDELDDMSEAASSYVLPKTVAPMGNQERSSVADSNLFNEGTLRGSILRGRSRIAQERMNKYFTSVEVSVSDNSLSYF